MIPNLDWSRFRAVLFDVDGTLYDQPQLRKIMARELLLFAATHPWRLHEIKILSTFRKLREENYQREESNLQEAQYRWTAQALGVAPATVQLITDHWLQHRPLRHLLKCRPPGLAELFARLRARKIKIGVFSDYPAQEKLKALQLQPDATACALDPEINRLKPDPAGLQRLCKLLNVDPCETLHIGDRQDRDDPCAKTCGCQSLILPAHVAKKTNAYTFLFP